MTLVVVVVVVGGITFIHGLGKPMYGLDAHVWSRRGVTSHSEIIV